MTAPDLSRATASPSSGSTFATSRQLARRPLCETCDQPALEVHHVVARAAGGAVFDPANLMSLCRPCHSRVTAKERTGRAYMAAGCGPDGYPRDPAHPFNAE